MEIIKNTVTLKNKSSYFSNKNNFCFLDIETTGLSRKYSYIYLIGILYWDKTINSFLVHQIFIDSKDKEKELLEYSIDLLNKFDFIINYNGTNFDIPFINTRALYHNLSLLVDKTKSFDIYRLLKKNKSLLGLKNLKLETVEEYLNIYREDQYSGLDCIYLYKDFQENNNSLSKEKVLLHNFEDLIYLNEILLIIDILYAKNSFKTIFMNSPIIFTIKDIQITNDFCNVFGDYEYNKSISIENYNNNYNFKLENMKFEASFIINKGLIEKDTIANFFNTDLFKININKRIFNNTPYKLPCNIGLISIDNNIFLENIKLILMLIFNFSISSIT